VSRDPETHHFDDDGAGFPNSRLPVLVYHDVGDCEARFRRHDWTGAWRNGIYSFHHFHSIAHEVLGVVSGSASVVLGGPAGRTFEVRPGDVLVLPAGTGHFNAGSSRDFLVVGAYPGGMDWDIRRGDPGERETVLSNLAAVPVPPTDPVHGPDGPLVHLWAAKAPPSA
jgi:uncharacterized protein YjlB